MQVIDLFAGIGGFSLAAHWMGWETSLFCEIEEFPQKVLAKNFPGIPIHDDIKTLTYEKYKDKITCRSDELILTGGFPCQPYSAAGKRKGNDDDRALWPEMLRVIREFSPSWVIGENVAGIVSMENEAEFEDWIQVEMEGKTFTEGEHNDFIYQKTQEYVLPQIIESLEQEGYAVQAFIIPACGIEAVHRRDRVWIVGRKTSVAHARMFQRDSKRESRQLIESGKRGDALGIINGATIEGIIANTISIRRQGQGRSERQLYQKQGEKRETNNVIPKLQWPTKPTVCRANDGVSSRMDRHRLKSLGNAIVPQVAYEIFKAIETEL